MTHWFSSVPNLISFVVIVAFWDAAALVAMAAVRLWAARRGMASGSPVVNAWATSCGSLAALLFAFTVVTLWNQDTLARTNLGVETSAMLLTARDLDPAQLPALQAYVLQTVVEWPQLCGGKPTQAVDDTLYALERSARPRAGRYGDNLFVQLGALESTRSRRWQLATASVPDEIWVALIVLACALLTVLAIAMPDRVSVHVVLMLAVGTALGALFWVTSLLEYPFCGSGAISPSEIVNVLRGHIL
ncbi:MAG TPA: hypothetical protein VMH02_06410 [Verrucomicrobiae bacterium]|nr:hypothetical protein [Verrucomicrobiae bacterium]